jgi:hypothetical protein
VDGRELGRGPGVGDLERTCSESVADVFAG